MDKKRSAKKTGPAEGSAENVHSKPPGIGRSAITGRYMSVASAKAHRKTAIVMGAKARK